MRYDAQASDLADSRTSADQCATVGVEGCWRPGSALTLTSRMVLDLDP
jgi:hypothetical protein